MKALNFKFSGTIRSFLDEEMDDAEAMFSPSPSPSPF
jgi:hypothetical protein